MSTFADLEADNPNIRQQRDEWAQARADNGENPVSWSAFRQHVIDIGAPDPGDTPPEDWVGAGFEGDTT